MFKKKKSSYSSFPLKKKNQKKENHTQIKRTAAFSPTLPELNKFQTRLSVNVQAQSSSMFIRLSPNQNKLPQNSYLQ